MQCGYPKEKIERRPFSGTLGRELRLVTQRGIDQVEVSVCVEGRGRDGKVQYAVERASWNKKRGRGTELFVHPDQWQFVPGGGGEGEGGGGTLSGERN